MSNQGDYALDLLLCPFFGHVFRFKGWVAGLGMVCLLLAGCGRNNIVKTVSVSWATPAAITYGTALSATQLNATANVPGTFAYNPSLGTILSAGKHTLSVTFTPADSTDSTTASVQITVNQATPQIIWVPTALIAVGAPIGPGQLDATATSSGVPVAGTFIYSPPAGTVFNSPGLQTLTVTFTPTDTLDYTTPPPFSLNNVPVSSFGVVCWGDSLTHGDKGNYDAGTYPDELAPLITIPVVNQGYDGQTSTQIGVREGAILTYATVAGEVIPATGSVTVTFPTGYEPVGPPSSTSSSQSVSGTILGVHGTVTIDSTNTTYTFTRTNPGNAVNAPGTGSSAPQFVVDKPYANYIPVFWDGRDNYQDTAQIISDVAAQVASVPAGQNYLVMSIINMDRPVEFIGAAAYKYIVADNTALQAAYGTHYLDIWKILVDSYNPSLLTDVSDYNHYVVPSSLRAINFYTTLASAIGPTDTTITFTQKCSHPCVYGLGAVAIIDPGGPSAEAVYVTAETTGDTVPVMRAMAGVDASHAAGAPVTFIDPVHLNAAGSQIVANAVAQYLSAYAK